MRGRCAFDGSSKNPFCAPILQATFEKSALREAAARFARVALRTVIIRPHLALRASPVRSGAVGTQFGQRAHRCVKRRRREGAKRSLSAWRNNNNATRSSTSPPAHHKRAGSTTALPEMSRSLAAARAAADRARQGGGACTLLEDGRVAQTWNDPLKPAPPQPAGRLINAGSYRKDERHELHAQARVLGRRSQSDASDKLDLDIASSETGVSRRQCSVQIIDGACRAAGLSAAQASGILRKTARATS